MMAYGFTDEEYFGSERKDSCDNFAEDQGQNSHSRALVNYGLSATSNIDQILYSLPLTVRSLKFKRDESHHRHSPD